MANPKKQMHEIVIPTDPLPVWYYVFDNYTATNHIAAHWHQGIELSYTVTGSIDNFNIGGQHYKTYTGKILLVNTQVIHSIDNQANFGDKAISLIFPYNYVISLYPDLNHQMIDLNEPDKFNNSQKIAYAKLQSLLTQFYWLTHTDFNLKNLNLLTIVNELLFLVLSNFTKEKPNNQQIGERKIYATNRLQVITQYVNNHYRENIHLQDIAQQCNISKEYLARFFKKQMEITVDTYLDNVRAQHAHYLLRSSTKNLTEIALESGFSSVRTMNRAFSNLYGETASIIKRKSKIKDKKGQF